jgi:hypothetical protein
MSNDLRANPVILEESCDNSRKGDALQFMLPCMKNVVNLQLSEVPSG